ncbi:MAG: asparaginase [Firmicutes bacterium]|nr:asparaginase [Bacillota bacterium]
MNLNKPRIAIIFTGGTISMKIDPKIAAAIPALSSNEILSMVTNVDKFADCEIIDFGRLPGPHMTPDKMMDLSNLVKETLRRDDITGIVITHGTDTLEETAYLLDLNIESSKPIIMVAAMRNGSELGYDGPSNLSGAICTAVSPLSKDKGTLIVLNNAVNSARETTKSHTLSLDTFKSMEFGPLGIVDNDEVVYYRNIVKHQHIETDEIERNVHLIKTYAGITPDIINYHIEKGTKGLVIEGMGRGNVPPDFSKALIEAINKGIIVIMVSRCPMGRVLDTYGYEGGGKKLREAGVIFGGNLNGQKALIKLMLTLTVTKDSLEIKKIFEKDFYK